ncbi:MAG: PolC-type DNA polymerase III [Lachnospiraceae bacterium]|nr:PolC-type DNA polymerase III [Lachnospiraceae bacterium]
MSQQTKMFFDAFPDFKCQAELDNIFQTVEVRDVVLSKKSNMLKVLINSRILIPKVQIYEMENELSSYLFQSRMKVKIIEHYELSGQYNVSRLTDMYKESLLIELYNESNVLYNIAKKAEWYVNEDVIQLTLDDTFLTRQRSMYIKNFLEHVYRERFDYDINVGFDYTEEQKEAIRAANQHKLELEVKHIIELGQERARELELNGLDEQGADKNKRSKAASGSGKKSGGHDGKASDGNKTGSDPNAVNFGRRSVGYSSFKKMRGRSYDPNVIYGSNVEGDVISISEITEPVRDIVVRGKIFSLEEKETKRGSLIIIFSITDFSDSISGKLFMEKDEWKEFKDDFGKGKFYTIKASADYDKYSGELEFSRIEGIKAAADNTKKRMDNALDKRVELHMHTVYSDNDSVVPVEDIIARAKEWGHPAIAITDHGVAQAFPVANDCIKKDDPFKIIYGCEGYFVDDLLDLIVNSKGQSLDDSYVVFDIETTGLNKQLCKIIEIGAVKIAGGEIVDRFSEFVNPEEPIPYKITELTSITDEMVIDAPNIDVILPRFLEFIGDSSVVAHNAQFDTSFIRKFADERGLATDYSILDTMTLGYVLCPELGKYTLDRLCKYLGIKLEHHHRAVDDAEATAHIFLRFISMLKDRGISNLDELNGLSNSVDRIRKLRRYHGIILAKNEIGRVNLNRLISESHITYFNNRPIMPKSLIDKYREGLILGSACEAGELYSALIGGADNEEIDRIVRFYDYLEIQPIGNNAFKKADEKLPNINTDEDLRNVNRRIVKLGETYNMPVVATCDVHFLDPEDSLYRAVIMASKGFKDADDQAPLYFRTTEEMLQEFDYLGVDKAREVVIDNTVKIANMVEKIYPVSPDKCPPIIENSDEELRRICYDKAHEIYGPNLPVQVKSRLDKELTSIIGNGYAVMYIIAQKLVWDSNDHGYLVGSRGSVGSSFVATMAGITEVNPLAAHYICPHCYYTDFDSELVKSYSGSSGCDMPDMECPKCGTMMKKEGHDIPFETFLGFYGDKEPDIDLNFSGEYQANAHAYTEELFGKGHAFRAGTIGKIAEKTAEQLVYKYYDERGISKRRCELARIAQGCVGVKRTTGQHPGGIVVVPRDREIYEFTAVQHPANDMKTDIVTTHFEYHSIDANLLKLDILGHDDPTIIRRLEDLTGKDAKTIALDDKNVMSLFHSPEVLGITSEDIGGVPTGSLGIPEFGTSFVIQMLVDTKPKSFSDLVRISGLSHGTDVWLNNAQTLIAKGKTELSGAICCRDDIMVYLIHMGLEAGDAFKIMENVRKGKVAKGKCDKWDGWVEDMRSHGVPEWYIGSCKLIKYMFPKAHAAAYVMMAWRIAWFKINEPLAYYSAYFSIRAKAFNYETMCQGKEHLEREMAVLKAKGKNERTAAEEESLSDMQLVQEMYARGFEFLPIDIYTVDDINCQIIDGKIMPPLCSISGIAGAAALQIKEAAKQGKFISKDDLCERAKIGKSTIEKLSSIGILNGLPESSQLSIFDM